MSHSQRVTTAESSKVLTKNKEKTHNFVSAACRGKGLKITARKLPLETQGSLSPSLKLAGLKHIAQETELLLPT